MSAARPWSNNQPFKRPAAGGGMPAAPAGGGGFEMPQAPQSPAGGFGGGGFGTGMPTPPLGGGGGAMPPGMPGGGENTDTGGLTSGPDGGGGFGGGQPFYYSPTFGGDTTNITNRNISTYRGGDRDYSRTYNQQKTNIDNSQTTMAARGGQQRQKIERMRPFKQKDYGMGEQMIGDPGLAMQQLKMMNSLMGLG
tara:strand:+ start:11187 stop:11768 length:582 start_codon:yes stop_codon:yes gene_type:complete